MDTEKHKGETVLEKYLRTTEDSDGVKVPTREELTRIWCLLSCSMLARGLKQYLKIFDARKAQLLRQNICDFAAGCVKATGADNWVNLRDQWNRRRSEPD